MTLEVRTYDVTDVHGGDQTSFDSGCLTIHAAELQELLLAEDERITHVTLDVAKPHESTRILCVKDVVEPRWNVTGGELGQGTLHVLKHIAVVTCGPIVGFQEGIIDMCGPGAEYSPFSSMPLLVLEIAVAPGLNAHAHEAIVRSAGLSLARQLAQLTNHAEPDNVEHIDWDASSVDVTLPRIVYVCMVLSQGLLHDTYVAGRNATEHLPRVFDPRAVIDNGIVSGNCVSACDKNTTFHHQNNPVIRQLLRGHGTRWNFAGLVVTNTSTRLGEKRRSAETAVRLVAELGAQGAVITKEGFGNPDADLMMIVRGLEQAGINTVSITDEFSGIDGGSHSLADTTPEANATVSVGNANQRLILPAMAKTIGPVPDLERLAGGYPHSLQHDGTIEVELQALISSTNELGFGRLTCREI